MKVIEFSHVVVIGAGLSGLAAARELALKDIQVTVLEARDQIAEPWRTRYPQLRLNIHRHFANLPGLAMTHNDGTFVRRNSVIEYLQRYARSLNLPIRFSTNVIHVEKTETHWRVATTKGEYTCAHLIIATGRDRIPHIPAWPGRTEFTGELLHSADLGDISRFDGKRVLVIGAGNSGTDALNQLSRHKPSSVWVSVRHGPAIVPARIFGFPLHRLARVFAALPVAVLDPAFWLTQRLFLGDLSRFGLRSHPDGGGPVLCVTVSHLLSTMGSLPPCDEVVSRSLEK